jgi:predicted Zn-dependent peptidase
MEYTKKILSNGTRVILAPNQGTQTVTIQILVEAGSKYENPKNNGISHFLEHMIFKGTTKRPTAKMIAEELDGVGGEFNAFTGKEQTGYWVKVPCKHFDMALDVVSDIYLNSTFKEKEIEKERGVILQEMAMYKDIPMRYIWDVFENLFYGNQPAGMDIIGTTENINAFQRKDFVDYLNKFYVPQSTVVVVSGNFNQEKALKEIEEKFSQKKQAKKTDKLKTTDNQEKYQLRIHHKETDQTHLLMGFKSVDMFSEKRFAVNLLATVLGGGMSSRMFEEIREKRGLSYYVNAGSDEATDSGYFFVGAGIKHQNLEKTIQLILKELKKVVDKKIPEKEIRKAKEYIKGKIMMSLESSTAVASFLGDQELFKGSIKKPEELFEKINQVKAKELQAIAKEIFVKKKLNLAIIGPHKTNKKIEKYLNF